MVGPRNKKNLASTGQIYKKIVSCFATVDIREAIICLTPLLVFANHSSISPHNNGSFSMALKSETAVFPIA